MSSYLTEQDYEQLSAYIDDALSSAERIALEKRLETEPTLQRELESLRQTVELIQQLPLYKAPRDFTLTPEMLASSARPAPTIPFRISYFVSQIAAMLLVIFGAWLIISQTNLIDVPHRQETQVLEGDSSSIENAPDEANDEIALAPTQEMAMTATLLPTQTAIPTMTQVLLFATESVREQTQVAQAPMASRSVEASPPPPMMGSAPQSNAPMNQTGMANDANTADGFESDTDMLRSMPAPTGESENFAYGDSFAMDEAGADIQGTFTIPPAVADIAMMEDADMVDEEIIEEDSDDAVFAVTAEDESAEEMEEAQGNAETSLYDIEPAQEAEAEVADEEESATLAELGSLQVEGEESLESENRADNAEIAPLDQKTIEEPDEENSIGVMLVGIVVILIGFGMLYGMRRFSLR